MQQINSGSQQYETVLMMQQESVDAQSAEIGNTQWCRFVIGHHEQIPTKLTKQSICTNVLTSFSMPFNATAAIDHTIQRKNFRHRVLQGEFHLTNKYIRDFRITCYVNNTINRSFSFNNIVAYCKIPTNLHSQQLTYLRNGRYKGREGMRTPTCVRQ